MFTHIRVYASVFLEVRMRILLTVVVGTHPVSFVRSKILETSPIGLADTIQDEVESIRISLPPETKTGWQPSVLSVCHSVLP